MADNFNKERRAGKSISRRLQCLIVEDNEMVSELYSELLNMLNCEVISARCLSQALNYISEYDFDLVLLDGLFPETPDDSPGPNYTAVALALTANASRTFQRPVISLITGDGSIAEAVQLTMTGIIDFVFRKPLSNATDVLSFLTEVAREGVRFGKRDDDALRVQDMAPTWLQHFHDTSPYPPAWQVAHNPFHWSVPLYSFAQQFRERFPWDLVKSWPETQNRN